MAYIASWRPGAAAKFCWPRRPSGPGAPRQHLRAGGRIGASTGGLSGRGPPRRTVRISSPAEKNFRVAVSAWRPQPAPLSPPPRARLVQRDRRRRRDKLGAQAMRPPPLGRSAARPGWTARLGRPARIWPRHYVTRRGDTQMARAMRRRRERRAAW